jgi:outer membrane protein assembly factor BamE (lipoprotein component of BamABCDE complex)
MRRVSFVMAGAAVLVLVVGCATMKRWERVEVGMTPAEVKAVMGSPQTLDAGDTGHGLTGQWSYKNGCHTRRYQVIFDKGKVVEKHAVSKSPWWW